MQVYRDTPTWTFQGENPHNQIPLSIYNKQKEAVPLTKLHYMSLYIYICKKWWAYLKLDTFVLPKEGHHVSKEGISNYQQLCCVHAMCSLWL